MSLLGGDHIWSQQAIQGRGRKEHRKDMVVMCYFLRINLRNREIRAREQGKTERKQRERNPPIPWCPPNMPRQLLHKVKLGWELSPGFPQGLQEPSHWGHHFCHPRCAPAISWSQQLQPSTEPGQSDAGHRCLKVPTTSKI